MDEEYHYDCPLLSKIIGDLAVVVADTRNNEEITTRLEKALDMINKVFKQLCWRGDHGGAV